MNIPVPGFMFFVSCIFITIHLSLFTYRFFSYKIYRHLEVARIRAARMKTVLVLFYMLNQVLFVLYCYLGFIISCYKDVLAYSAPNVGRYEKMLQGIEMLFECFEKTIMFVSLTLFLPILRTVSDTFVANFTQRDELKTVLAYTLLRSCVYTAVFIAFHVVPMLGLYLIEILTLAECLVMCYIYVYVDMIVRCVIENRKDEYGRENQLMKNQLERFKVVTRIYVLQLVVEVVYKAVVVGIMLKEDNNINMLCVNLIFLLKLLCYTLLFMAFMILIVPDDHSYPKDIFWTPRFSEDMMFFSEQELSRMNAEREVDRIGNIPNPNARTSDGRIRHAI